MDDPARGTVAGTSSRPSVWTLFTRTDSGGGGLAQLSECPVADRPPDVRNRREKLVGNGVATGAVEGYEHLDGGAFLIVEPTNQVP